MNRSILNAALYLVLLCAAISCKKDSKQAMDAPGPAPYAHGTLMETPIQKSIGPEGGTIRTPDGRFSVTIPAGAVTAATGFSLQPVTRVLELGSGNAFRLKPENVPFSQPVEISLHYDDADLDGAAPECLFLAYQDTAGYWHHVQTALDTVHRILKASTRHFSDWTARRSFAMDADKRDLEENDQAKLEISYQDISDDPAGQSDDLLGPTIRLKEHISDWKVHGPGVVKGNGANAVYTAPATIPTPATAYVSAVVKGMVNKTDPTREGTDGKVILEKRLNLGGEECKITVNGTTVILSAATITQVGNSVLLSAQSGVQGLGLSFNVTNGDIIQGKTYPVGPRDQPGRSMIATNLVTGKQYASEYTNCDPLNPEKKYGAGSVKITVWGEAGDLVEGSFSATLYYDDPHDLKCEYKSIPVSGTFKLKRFD